jgi:hypothetical protein
MYCLTQKECNKVIQIWRPSIQEKKKGKAKNKGKKWKKKSQW